MKNQRKVSIEPQHTKISDRGPCGSFENETMGTLRETNKSLNNARSACYLAKKLKGSSRK